MRRRYSKVVDGKSEIFEKCEHCGKEIQFKGSWDKIEDIDAKDWAESAFGYCPCGVNIHCDGMCGDVLKKILENPVRSIMNKKEFADKIIKEKTWEDGVPTTNQVISTGNVLSVSALEVAFSSLQCNPDVIVTSFKIWETMKDWGYGDCCLIEENKDPVPMELLRSVVDDKINEGAYAKIWEAGIFVTHAIPQTSLVIGNIEKNAFAKVEVSPES